MTFEELTSLWGGECEIVELLEIFAASQNVKII